MSRGWTLAIQILGAAAGIGLLATFVGGSMLWLRFDALDLPADRAVALLPKEMLVVVGAHALVIPVLIGLVATLIVALMEPLEHDGTPRPRFRRTFLPLVTLAIAALVGFAAGMEPLAMLVVAIAVLAGIAAVLAVDRALVKIRGPETRARLVALGGYVSTDAISERELWLRRGAVALTAAIAGAAVYVVAWKVRPAIDVDVPVALAAIAAGALACWALFKTAVDADHVAQIAFVTFATFAVLGAMIGVTRTYFKPRMEPLAVLLAKDDRGRAGFFVGETSDRLYFVMLPSNGDPGDPLADADADRVVAIPRSKVVQVAMREPTGVRPDEPGREQANTLLGDIQQSLQGATAVKPIATVNPQVAFAPLVHLHADENLFPMSARGFLDNSVLGWSNLGTGCDNVKIAAGATLLANGDEDLPRLQDAKLGNGEPPYEHGPGDSCLPAGRSYPATAHTRPHDKRPRSDLGAAQGFYLDFDNDLHEGHTETEDDGPQEYLRDVPAYVQQRVLPAQERAVLALGAADVGAAQLGEAFELTYWLFYGLSRPPSVPDDSKILTHEGDWERIAVTIVGVGPKTEGRYDRYLPLSVRYHYHDDSRLLPWHAVRRAAGAGGAAETATHPIVYSAKGSHASYWRAGRYESEYRPNGKRLFAVHDDAIACQKCPRWQTWDLVLDVTGERWYGFGGAWGVASKRSDGTGPLGPSRYKVRGLGTPTTETVNVGEAVPSSPTAVREDVATDE